MVLVNSTKKNQSTKREDGEKGYKEKGGQGCNTAAKGKARGGRNQAKNFPSKKKAQRRTIKGAGNIEW